MNLNQKQIETKVKVEFFAKLFGIEPEWAVAIAFIESSLGIQQRSATNCKGVFQMSSIAMKDLLLSMPRIDDDYVDIVCGIAFLRLLLKRHKSIKSATEHYCNPDDREFYIPKMQKLMQEFSR